MYLGIDIQRYTYSLLLILLAKTKSYTFCLSQALNKKIMIEMFSHHILQIFFFPPFLYFYLSVKVLTFFLAIQKMFFCYRLLDQAEVDEASATAESSLMLTGIGSHGTLKSLTFVGKASLPGPHILAERMRNSYNRIFLQTNQVKVD